MSLDLVANYYRANKTLLDSKYRNSCYVSVSESIQIHTHTQCIRDVRNCYNTQTHVTFVCPRVNLYPRNTRYRLWIPVGTNIVRIRCIGSSVQMDNNIFVW